MDKCKECGEFAVEVESHFSQEQSVCKACGAVSSEGSFATEKPPNVNDFQGRQFNTLPWKIQKTGYKAPPVGEQLGLKKLDILASAFSVPSFMKSEAKELLQRALQHPAFIRVHVDKKIALAACCMYVIFRQNQWPVTISSLCELVQVTLHLFNSTFKSLLSEFQISLTTTPIEELTNVYLKDASIDSKDEIIKKCIAIVEFGRDVWVVRANKPEGIISAAAFVAWVSKDINRRKKVTYKCFCQQSKLPVVQTGPMRFRELLNMLTMFAEKLPWIEKKKLKKMEVLHALDDVLKFSNTLRASIEDDDKDGSSQRLNTYAQNSKKRKVEDEPPSLCNNLNVSNSSELTEDDIPSNQMHKYLRTAEEVEQLKKLRSMLPDLA